MQLLLVNFQILFYIKITNCFTDIKLMEQFIMKNSIKHANIIGCFRKKGIHIYFKSFLKIYKFIFKSKYDLLKVL